MKTIPKWLVHLFPSRDRTFRQRFAGVLVTWGCPIILWEAFASGVFRSPSQLPFFLALELPGTVVGVTFYALIEHALYGRARKRDCR